MFLFSCCTEMTSHDIYEIRTKKTNQNTFEVMKTQDRNNKKPIEALTQVLKVKKSEYRELIKMHKNTNQAWEDFEFPHNDRSVGKIEGVQVAQWKRLSTIITNPVLFDGKIQPQDAIQGSLGDCYFLSAVAALAERQDRIKNIFGEQEGIKNGIYRVILRVNGVIEEILVDDFVPVNNKGEPIFCQPNKNQIWVPILEKAWAKANGSYANIAAGTPSEIFRATTYAPAQTLDTGNGEQIDHLWKIILDHAKLNRPCCCGTDDSPHVNWQSLHLVPGHAYTLLDATELEIIQGQKVRMLKLRNPWGNTEWQGQGCEKDSKFWSSVVNSQDKTIFLRESSINNDGIFYIRFRDYCKYFSQTHICYLQTQGNYIYEEYQPSPKHGVHWKLTIFEEGEYSLELHQAGVRGQETEESTLARQTIVLAKNLQPSGFQLVNGVLSHYRPDCSLKAKLTPGQYTIFTKFDINQKQHLPSQASISVYSHHYAILDSADPIKSDPMLKQCMLNHAKSTKRRRYQNDTLWISWKLMYKQGGYAYICFGAEKEAHSTWNVTFSESDFENSHFKLKKPWKKKGEGQGFEVKPGEQKIIVVRVKNDTPTSLRWPPKISYKVEPIV